MLPDVHAALALIREKGVLNQFSTPADDWFVAASEHRENSHNEGDFIENDIGRALIDAGLVRQGEASCEDDTLCRTWHLNGTSVRRE